jgi:hypothetical protein
MHEFLEKLLQVLGQGGFSSTYKFATLLALIDLCVEAGEPPSSVTTAQLARRVVELYWPQVRGFGPQAHGSHAPPRVLAQNRGVPAKITELIRLFREQHPDQVALPRRDDPHFARLLDEVEWKLVEMPLPRLQRVGGTDERFLYEIGWEEGVSRRDFTRYKAGDGAAFDNLVRFRDGAAGHLVALAAVIRPIVQQQWLAMVRSINELPDADAVIGTRTSWHHLPSNVRVIYTHVRLWTVGPPSHVSSPARSWGTFPSRTPMPISRVSASGAEHPSLAHADPLDRPTPPSVRISGRAPGQAGVGTLRSRAFALRRRGAPTGLSAVLRSPRARSPTHSAPY